MAEDLFADRAPAKVNLTLRVVGRRADGYHELESLVAFARECDRLTFVPGGEIALIVQGPTATASGSPADNLVLKAARLLARDHPGLRPGRFELTKELPVAAGLGGGSSDAAAALRLLARANGIALNDPRLFAVARAIGADVPVCIDPRPRMMRGVGDVLSAPLPLPALAAVLINPGIAVPTRDVFARLQLKPDAGGSRPDAVPNDRDGLLNFLNSHPNDLEAPAVALHPVIAGVLDELRRLPGCRLARMSGSGATCFGLFDDSSKAAAAVRVMQSAHSTWWVRATVLGG